MSGMRALNLALITVILLVAGVAVGHALSQKHTASSTPSCRGTCATAPSPTPTGHLGTTIIAQDAAAVRSSGYQPDYHAATLLPDGTPLYAFHGVCAGSADGHCQAVEVFLGERASPVWHRQYGGVLSLHTTQNGFAVKAVSYGPQDPLCCPSRPPVTDAYTWEGTHFVEHGPLPRSPGS